MCKETLSGGNLDVAQEHKSLTRQFSSHHLLDNSQAFPLFLPHPKKKNKN